MNHPPAVWMASGRVATVSVGSHRMYQKAFRGAAREVERGDLEVAPVEGALVARDGDHGVSRFRVGRGGFHFLAYAAAHEVVVSRCHRSIVNLLSLFCVWRYSEQANYVDRRFR